MDNLFKRNIQKAFYDYVSSNSNVAKILAKSKDGDIYKISLLPATARLKRHMDIKENMCVIVPDFEFILSCFIDMSNDNRLKLEFGDTKRYKLIFKRVIEFVDTYDKTYAHGDSICLTALEVDRQKFDLAHKKHELEQLESMHKKLQDLHSDLLSDVSVETSGDIDTVKSKKDSVFQTLCDLESDILEHEERYKKWI